MRNCLKNKRFLSIFLLIFLVAFLVLPKFCLADDFKEITPEKMKKYLELPEKDTKNILSTLNQAFTTERIKKGDSLSIEEVLTLIALQKIVNIDVLNYLLLDVPVEIAWKVMKESVDIAQIILSKDIKKAIEKLEKESVKEANKYAMNYLVQNEIRVSSGAIEYEYLSQKGEIKRIIIQYILIYQPADNKYGKVSIRFYSYNPIAPPSSKQPVRDIRGIVSNIQSAYNLQYYIPPFQYDLPPFVVEISGRVKKFEFGKYWWVDKEGRRFIEEGGERVSIQPSVKITFPEEVPDLGIKPLSFWQRHILQPIKTAFKDVTIIITRVTGKSPKIVENLFKIPQTIVDTWNEIKSFFSKINPFSPAALVEIQPSETKKPSTKLGQQVGQERPGKETEEADTKPLQTKPEIGLKREPKLTLSEIQKILDDISENIDAATGEITKLTNTKVKPSKQQETKKEEKQKKAETKKKKIKKKKTKLKEELSFCSINQGSVPKRNKIIVNEIAWMGTSNSANDEWIELKNVSEQGVDLAGWQLLDKDRQIKIIFNNQAQILVNGFYLLERTNDDSVPGITADFIYTGGLKNTNEALYLFDQDCQLQDKIEANPNWPAGDNSSKRTMERKANLSWQTSASSGGTPKKENSSGYIEVFTSVSRDNRSGGSGGVSYISYPKILISEIQIAGIDDQKDEFVELYNFNNFDVNLTDWYLQRKTKNSSKFSTFAPKSLFAGKKIGAKSYLLLARQDSAFESLADVVFSYPLGQDNSLALKNPNREIVDRVGWGKANDFERAPAENPLPGQSLGRKWLSSEYQDTDNNSEDFEIQNPTPKSQNISKVKAPPVLGVSPKNLEFSLNPFQKSIFISNIGGGVLSWQSSVEYVTPQNTEWLNLSPRFGQVLAGSTSEVSVSPIESVSGIREGIYSAKIIIDAGEIEGSPTQVEVRWDKQCPSDETPPRVEFSLLPATLSSNSFILSWQAQDPIGNVSPSGIDSFLLNYDVTPSEDGLSLWYFKEGWQNWSKNETIKTSENQIKLLAEDGYSYSFQLRAIDRAGNLSSQTQASTKISLPVSRETVVINEIAWMGTKASSFDEWIELYNNSNQEINLAGWGIYEDETLIEPLTGKIGGNSYYLIERSDENTIKDITADQEPSGWGGYGLNNNGEKLILLDPFNNLIDEVDCSTGWFAGDNFTKQTMEKIDSTKSGSDSNNWANNNLITRNGLDAKGDSINGTPKAKNSVSYPPPESITDLTAGPGATRGTIDLFWTAPGDKGERVKSYIIKYFGEKIIEGNWSGALEIPNGISPREPESIERFTVSLEPGRTYYFAIKSESKTGAVSEISNSPKAQALLGFQDNEDGTITDLSTGLVWVKDGAGLGANNGNPLTWAEAIDFSNNLVLCNDGTFQEDVDCSEHSGIKYDDWRLPNLKELQSIIDYGKEKPTIDPIFTNTIRELNYSTGTASFNNGSKDVVGNGTFWISAMAGGRIKNEETGNSYEIARVISRTQLELAEFYTDEAGSSFAYTITYNSNLYWTSSSTHHNISGCWKQAPYRVNFNSGLIFTAYKDLAWSFDSLFIRPVRGQSNTLPITGQTKSYREGDDVDLQMGCQSYTDNGDTITDNCTGLMWVKDGKEEGGNNGKSLNWEEAIKFSNNLDFAGYSDWRMPNVRELMSIASVSECSVVPEKIICATHSDPYYNWYYENRPYGYWSASSKGGECWIVRTKYYRGEVVPQDAGAENIFIRPVRSIKNNE